MSNVMKYTLYTKLKKMILMKMIMHKNDNA